MKRILCCVFSLLSAIYLQASAMASPIQQTHDQAVKQNSNTQAIAGQSFAKNSTKSTTICCIKISPTGHYLAIKTQRFGKATLTFLDRKNLEVLGGLALKGKKEVGDFYWANDNRVVSEIRHIAQNSLSTYHGALFAINVDGSQKSLIQSEIANQVAENDLLKVVDPLPENDGHVLVSSKPLQSDILSDEKVRGIATLLNIYNEIEQTEIGLLPVTLGKFYINDAGNLQMALGSNETEQLYISGER